MKMRRLLIAGLLLGALAQTNAERVYSSAFPSLADAAKAAAGKTLVIDGKFFLTNDATLSVPDGCIMVEPPGMLITSPGTVLTLASPFLAPPVPIFSAPKSGGPVGKVRFSTVEHIYAEWWGATADGKTDNTEAFQRMFDATYDNATGSYRNYAFLEGRYVLKGTVTLDPKPVPPVAFGIQTAPALLGAGMGSVTPYLGVGTTFVKNTAGPMFVIAGRYDLATDRFEVDSEARANPKYFTTGRVRFMSTLPPDEVRKVKPVGILGESRHARIRDSIFTGLWTGIDNRGYSDYSLYEGCIFDCFKGVVLRSPDATGFIRCQFGETFLLRLQGNGGACGPAITMMGGDVRLESCSMNYYGKEWAIRLLGTGFPVLSIDDLHAEGCLVLNANCTPFEGQNFSGSRVSIANSRMGGSPQGGKCTVTLNNIDGAEIANSVFYQLPQTVFPPALFSVSHGNLVVRGTSFIQEITSSPYAGKTVTPGAVRGEQGQIVFQ